MSGGFYIILPSNACLDAYPHNTNSNFTIQLAQPLDLQGEWEVGLAEIQYPNSWFTIREHMTFRLSKDSKDWEFQLKKGYYKDIPDIVKAMNYNIQTRKDPPDVFFYYDSTTGKVNFRGPEVYEFSATEELSHIVGIYNTHGNPVKPHRTADITGGFTSLYLYTDIIEHQIVGDFSVPLLRCVPVKGKSHECITVVYDRPYYIPVSKSHIHTITVEIKTDLNRHVPFRVGKVIVRLHFRPRKAYL